MKDLSTGKTLLQGPFFARFRRGGLRTSAALRRLGSVPELPLGTLRKRTLARTRPREV